MTTQRQAAAEQIERILRDQNPISNPLYFSPAYDGEILIHETGRTFTFDAMWKPNLIRIVTLMKPGDSLVVNCLQNNGAFNANSSV